MGLTREQLKNRAISEAKDYILKNGLRLSNGDVIWSTYPVCIKDICVSNVGIIDNELVYGDYEDNTFNIRKYANDVSTNYIKDCLEDMIHTDKIRKKSK